MPNVERWTVWEELRDAAPTLFPVRVDRDMQRYAKRLRKYVEGAPDDAPGLARAKAMLAAFEQKAG